MIRRDLLLRALAAKAARRAEVNDQLQQPDIASDVERMVRLSRELGQLKELASLHAAVVADESALADARAMLESEDDDEMRALARAEIDDTTARLDAAYAHAEEVLAEDDELAGRDVILEIRAGVGGAEAALFAGELFAMYSHFCAARKLKVEVLDAHEGEMGGYKEITAEVSGVGAYKALRFESGGHRVQRVPKTESQGRIHTSAATVAVLPKAEALDVDIDWDKDVREDKMRAGGPGGQKVNKTESAIRLTHLETGITVHMQDEKSQHKNRSKARSILAARVLDHHRRAADSERAAQRKGMIGSGDRSQRIRTYNFPQNRVTAHRIEWSFHDLEGFLLGNLEPLHERLRLAEREARLEALAEQLEAQGASGG